MFNILNPIDELQDSYVSDLVWCGANKFIAVTSDLKYPEEDVPYGEKNSTIATFYQIVV